MSRYWLILYGDIKQFVYLVFWLFAAFYLWFLWYKGIELLDVLVENLRNKYNF